MGEPAHDEDGVVTEELVPITEVSALTVVSSEIGMQLDAAHRYPRSVKRFLDEAKTLATMDVETAASCIYSVPRSGKTISGPSVRLAEICVSAWGNSHIGARIVGTDATNVIAQGAAWDLEKNLRITMETRRRITQRNGDRYNEDMITVTGNAAASIALRNAIFKIIPRAYVDAVYSAARKVAVGDASTLADRRPKVMERLTKMGATPERVLATLGKPSVADLTVDDLEYLVGLGTAIKNGEKKIDEVFPEVRPPITGDLPREEQGKRMSLRREKPAAEAPAQASLPVPREPGEEG